jgi:hypothetical protein
MPANAAGASWIGGGCAASVAANSPAMNLVDRREIGLALAQDVGRKPSATDLKISYTAR